MRIDTIEQNPDDPRVIFHNHFVRSIAATTQEALGTTIFREMPPRQQLETIVNGILTGLIAIAFSQVTEDGRAPILSYIQDSIDPSSYNAAQLLEQYRDDIQRYKELAELRRTNLQ